MSNFNTQSKKRKTCSKFKPMSDYISHYQKKPTQNCNECVYFSSRNCGFDIYNSIETDLDIF